MGFLSSFFKKKAPAPARPAAPPTLNWRVTVVTKETPTTISFEVDGSIHRIAFCNASAVFQQQAGTGRVLQRVVERLAVIGVRPGVEQQLRQ